ncbi:hypothetical protein OSB04_002156 [Centaurea solstitialis]|uniref:Retrotransposon gag domain-containing protein n=1 Tax=Centaurea solstitialis TaxID=347529 RepID=A0AA38TSE6_9ASTR|nr:hypothetical protein OSB04_002156 [Centaurea solstitialis]
MERDRKLFLEELPFPENQPDERFNDDGLPPPLPPPPGVNGKNQQQVIQPHVAQPHVGPILINQGPGPQVQEGNPVNGILRNPPIPNNRQIEDAEQHIFRLANSKDSSMMDYAIPIVHQLQSGIRDPTSTVPHFELKTVLFQMLQNNGQFAGLSKEDPHAHLRSFIEIADSFRLRGVSDDVLKLKLFPFSLSHHARAWYNSLKLDSITTWNQMAESRNEICTFRQDDDEAVPTAWERFKELLRKCPHHGIPYCIQLETFYNGLNYSARQMLDATAGGAFTASSYNEGYNILEKFSNNNGHWADSRSKPLQLAGTKGDGAYSAHASQLHDMAVVLKNLTTNKQVVSSINTPEPTELPIQCAYCGENHLFDNCLGNPEKVNYIGNNDKTGTFSPTYNPGWRDHPNLKWNSPTLNPQLPRIQDEEQPRFQHTSHNHSQNHQQTTYPKYQQRQNQQVEPSLEAMMKGFITQTQASIKNLETQVGQMALEIRNRPTGSLPSDTETPQRIGKEHVKAVTLRNGKDLNEKAPIESGKKNAKSEKNFASSSSTQTMPSFSTMPLAQSNFTSPVPDFPLLSSITSNEKLPNEANTTISNTMIKPASPIILPSPPTPTPQKSTTHTPVPLYVPYPQRLRNQKEEDQFKKFLDVFKQLHINIPLVEAIEQMPNYAKFLKDILSKKKKLNEYETVALTEGCSALITNKIPPKMKDPGSFTVPCSIVGKTIGKALCDLGASINLMPLSVFNTLGIGEARPTTVSLQLADKSIAWPKGKIEDVLVQVDKFIFPADFIILDCEVDKDVPIILGRPFLATGRTLIDVQKGELTMRVQDQKVTFNVLDSLRYPEDREECSTLSEIESWCQEKTLGYILGNEDSESDEEESESDLEAVERKSTKKGEKTWKMHNISPVAIWRSRSPRSGAAKFDKDEDQEYTRTDTQARIEKEEVIEWKFRVVPIRCGFRSSIIRCCTVAPLVTAAFEILENEDRKTLVPSLEFAPDLELKQLPSHLKYAFLGDSGKLPVIISSSLEKDQEEKLIKMLKQHTKAIGWTIADLKGISPTVVPQINRKQ